MTSRRKTKLFNDILRACKFRGGLSQFSDSVRDRLGKYERNVRKEIVSRLDEDDTAPLFYACQTGKVEMIEYLISTCGADVEQKGLYDGFGGIMVSPLWCAAHCCDKRTIEVLLSHGSDVNAPSEWGSTPVIAACDQADDIDDSVVVDLVEYLVEHGADIHRPDKYGGTCLMEAVRRVDLCKFLLRNDAAVNVRHANGGTALHCAIYENKLDTVKLLVDYGADVTVRARWSGDALQTACFTAERSGQTQPIFDYLVERRPHCPGCEADANELMGAYRNRVTETLEFWRKAMEIRISNAVDGKPLAKTPFMPKRDCYGNASEFTTLDELNALALDSDAFNIQKLLVFERVLGEDAGATSNAIYRMGELYIESSRYKNCFDLWRRALEIRIVNSSISWNEVYSTAAEFVGALYHLHERTPLEEVDPNRVNEEQPRFADVVAVFKLLTSRRVIAEPPSRELLAIDEEEGQCYDLVLESISQLIDLLGKTARTSEAENEVRALVRRLVNQNPISPRNHQTLLHRSVSRGYAIRSRHFPDREPIFPNLEVTKLLLECKADVNARNVNGETSLHIAISCSGNFPNQLIELLLDHGAHLDIPDKLGRTPAHILSTKPDNTVNLANHMTLRCLAAQAVVQYEIQCNDLPATLKQFLDLHRPL